MNGTSHGTVLNGLFTVISNELASEFVGLIEMPSLDLFYEEIGRASCRERV